MNERLTRAQTIKMTGLEIGAEILYERWQEALADRDLLAGQLTQTTKALERVRDNAISWHGTPADDSGHARALAVIAEWCDAALVSGGETR